MPSFEEHNNNQHKDNNTKDHTNNNEISHEVKLGHFYASQINS
jgi:hypothetical protein